jgi:segregation and condensation protein B
MIETTHLKNVIEAALLAAGKPLQITELAQLFEEHARPDQAAVRTALDALIADYEGRGIEVKETATGFRIQVRKELAPEVSRLWPERPAKYTRALLETLALIAYRQPITRAEIEAVRGVAVNPNIIKTLLERGWVRVIGTRDVPGRPELLGTTREFLDYFSLKSLDELPPLAEIKTMTDPNLQLALTAATPTAAVAVDGLNGEAPANSEAASADQAGVSAESAIGGNTGSDDDSPPVATAGTEQDLEDGGEGSVASESATDAPPAAEDSQSVDVDAVSTDDENAEGVDDTEGETDADTEAAASNEDVSEAEVALDDDNDVLKTERTLESHSSEDDEDIETRKAQASDDVGFDDELNDDDDEDDAEGESAELVAARRNYED